MEMQLCDNVAPEYSCNVVEYFKSVSNFAINLSQGAHIMTLILFEFNSLSSREDLDKICFRYDLTSLDIYLTHIIIKVKEIQVVAELEKIIK